MDQIYHFFTNAEAQNMDKEFMATLDRARQEAGVPFVITRGYSTPEHNFSVGGAIDSAHTHVDENGNPASLAVDLLVTDNKSAYLTIRGLLSAGISRLGFYFKQQEGKLVWSHVHADSDASKPQGYCWTGIDGKA